MEIEGSTVREVVQNLEAEYPGIRDRICQEDRINPSIAVAVDGQISNEGMRRKVGPESEVQFIPAIGGGRGLTISIFLGSRCAFPRVDSIYFD